MVSVCQAMDFTEVVINSKGNNMKRVYLMYRKEIDK